MAEKINILIDVGHPAHVHVLRNFAQIALSKGNNVLFTCREKEFIINLLRDYNLPFKSLGKKYATIPGKIWGLVKSDFKELITSLHFRPDIFLSCGSITAAHVSSIMRKPSITFEDTYNFEQVLLYLPFTDVVLTADYDHPLKSKKVIKYPGYHELNYLHPNYFQPDPAVKKELGVLNGERYSVLRFVSWRSSHDFGQSGISNENKIRAVNSFLKHSKVFISSETPLPSELRDYLFPLSPSRIHDAMAFASLFYGESATMATEAAVLGVPGIFLNTKGTYYTRDIEKKYGLIFNYTESQEDQLRSIEKGVEILSCNQTESKWKSKRENLLSEKIDVTAFLLWFIDNFPESRARSHYNEVFWERFK